MSAVVKVECKDIAEGDFFSEAVFFDDGENMFLAPKRPVKRYHLMAIRRWNIPYLLTEGAKIQGDELDKLLESFSEQQNFLDAEDLEELEEL